MKCLEKQINITYSNYFSIVTISALILLIFAFVFNISYVHHSAKKINENQEKIELLLKNIENKPVETTKQQAYKLNQDFIANYYTIQSDWLNKWFTILAIIIGVFGVMIPICFVKFLENKEKEMDRIIKDAIKQKKKTKLNIEEMENKIRQVNQKAETMDEQLKEVKKYVYKTEALSKFMEGEQKFRDNQFDEAKDILTDSLKLNPDNDKANSLLAETYLKLKNYDEAQKYLFKALEINQSSRYYDLLTQISLKNQNYNEAVKYHKKAFELAKITYLKAYYLSCIAADYSYMNDNRNTNDYIQKAISLNSNPTTKGICAMALINIKEYKRAIELLKELEQYGNATDFYNLTEAYIMDGQFENALEALKKYVKAQDAKTMEGIFKDDYAKWRGKLISFQTNDFVKQIFGIIDSLKKEDRY